MLGAQRLRIDKIAPRRDVFWIHFESPIVNLSMFSVLTRGLQVLIIIRLMLENLGNIRIAKTDVVIVVKGF